MNLIINPRDLPRHFARSIKGDWLIKRSPVTPEGFRYYSCEHWVSGGRMGGVIVIKAKFLLHFVEEIMRQRGIEVMVLSSEDESGKLTSDMTLRMPRKRPRKKAA